jgi:hypothetical protein
VTDHTHASDSTTQPELLAQLAQSTTDRAVLLALAGNPGTPATTLTALAGSAADLGMLLALAQNPNTPGEGLATLLEHPVVRAAQVTAEEEDWAPTDYAGYSPYDRMTGEKLSSLYATIAVHPNLSETALAALATLEDMQVTRAITSSSIATPQVLAQIVDLYLKLHTHATQQVLEQVAQNPRTPGSTLEIIACVGTHWLFEGLVVHPQCTVLTRQIMAFRQRQGELSEEGQRLLVQHGTAQELIDVAGYAGTPAALLDTIRTNANGDTRILAAVAGNPRAKTATLQTIADWMANTYELRRRHHIFSEGIRSIFRQELFAALINNPQSTPEIRATLERFGPAITLFELSTQQKSLLALNPATPVETLSLLALDLSENLLCDLANNRSAPVAALEPLVGFRSQRLEDALARNPHTTAEMLRELYKRHRTRPLAERHNILFAVHPHTPPDILAELARLNDPYLRAALEPKARAGGQWTVDDGR